MMMIGGLFVDNEIYELGLELTKKIQQFYPNYEFVYGDDGNIIDVTATEPVPVEEIPEPPTNAELAAAIAELAEVICGG